MKRGHDALFLRLREDKGDNLLVPWILMTSYLYYIEDISILSGHLFDNMCRELMEKYDTVEHRHKHLICKEGLSSGSLFDLTEDDYPHIVKGAARQLARELI